MLQVLQPACGWAACWAIHPVGALSVSSTAEHDRSARNTWAVLATSSSARATPVVLAAPEHYSSNLPPLKVVEDGPVLGSYTPIEFSVGTALWALRRFGPVAGHYGTP